VRLFGRRVQPEIDPADLETLKQRASAAEAEALRLGKMLAAMPDGLLLVADGRLIRYANPASARLLGGDPARIVGPLQANSGSSFVIQVHHPVYREVRCHRTRLDPSTELIIARDVTEAQRVDRMRTDFVANASHELKTPVAAIQAAAETLKAAIADDPEAAARFAEALASDAQRLSALVQDLLDLARLDEASPNDASCDAADVVRQVSAVQNGIEITTEVTGSLPVPVSERDLSVAITNLLENAARHAQGGSIKVTARGVSGWVEISVADDGEGIPAKDLPRIFERFYRVDRARARETGGTGLGLAIVKHIAEQAGGTVSADSVLGEGATFTLRFALLPGS
jgi:signal transduction histidine kinase